MSLVGCFTGLIKILLHRKLCGIYHTDRYYHQNNPDIYIICANLFAKISTDPRSALKVFSVVFTAPVLM